MTLESIESLAFPAQILDQVHDCVVATNMSGRIEIWNRGAERLHGFSAEEAVGQHVSIVFPPGEYPKFDAKRLESFFQSGFHEFDTLVHTKAGRVRPIHVRLSLLRNAANVPVGVLSFSLDTTDLQKARADLQNRERQLRTILDAIPGLVVHLDPQLRIKFSNKAYAALVNCPSGDLVGRDGAHLFGDGNPVAAQLLNIIRVQRGSLVSSEIEFVSEDGARKWMAIQHIPDIGANGDVQGYFVVGTDLTETKRLQAVSLGEERRLREILVSEVHHRVKNSLQGIVGLLRTQATKSPDLAAALAPAITQVLSISVGFGLTSTRSRFGIVLCDMVREISRNVGQVTGALISTEMDGAILERPIVLDRSHGVNLGMIVNELIFNAVKHGEAPAEGPRIMIAISRTLETATVRIANFIGSASIGFDFPSGRGLGTGLSLVRALLPSRGSDLSFTVGGGQVTAVLNLRFDTLGIVHQDHQDR